MTPREALTELGVRFVEAQAHHHVREGWVGCDCPLCSPGSGRIRLGLNLSGVYLSCWACGRLPLYETLADLSGRSVREVSGVFRGVRRLAAPKVEERRGRLVMPEGLTDLLPPHSRYLEGRGFDPEYLIKVWGVKGIGPHAAPGMAWRVFVPVRKGDQVVSWTARATSDGEGVKRYRNARPDQEALPAKSLLYGAEHVRHGVIVHEGPTDCWRTGPGAAATMGLAYSRSQLQLLSQFPVRIVVFDSEPEAQRRAERLCDDLACFPGRTLRVELDSPDPGSATDREVRALRRMIR